jgi:isoquinoline 1-oxidoreductase beta subunit
MEKIKRRDFLKLLTAGGLTLAVIASPIGYKIVLASNSEENKDMFVPNAWLHIAENDKVIVIVNKSEMGQGVYTSLPMIIVDELGASWKDISVLSAPAGNAYVDPLIGGQLTGGSTSIRHMYEPLRLAGAAAREMLIQAAAEKWKISKENCYTKDGKVIGTNGKEINFGILVNAAKKISPPSKPSLKNKSDFYIIGKPVDRIDTILKVNGKAEFGIDVFKENMFYAVVKRPPYYGAKVEYFDKNSAKNIGNFIDAFEITNGIAIVAKTIDAALKAKEILKVDFGAGELPELDTAYIEKILKESIDKNGIIAKNTGNAKKTLTEAPKKVQAAYLLPYLAHTNMEPMNCTAFVGKDTCKIWVPTQAQSSAFNIAKQITGLPDNKIFIYTTYLGTGFGRRAETDYVKDAIEISKKTGSPVKIIWTREDDFTHDFYRPANYSFIKAGLDDRGRILTWEHKIAVPSIWERVNPASMKNGIDNAAVEGLSNLPYDVPNIYVEFIKVNLPVPVGFWRSVGSSHNAFTVESFIDELAYAANKDPLGFRLQHLSRQKRAANLLNLVAEKINWHNKEKGYGYGIAQHFSFGTYSAQAAKIKVDEKTGRIKVDKVVAAVDCGSVINPEIVKDQITGGIIMGLSAALKEKMEFKNGGAITENFHNYDPLRQSETPEIEVHIVESGEALGGIGEPGVPPSAPMVANAIFNLTGIRCRNLPITSDIFLTEKDKQKVI